MTERCPAALSGSRHVWMFDFDAAGELRQRCVWCQQWYEPEKERTCAS